jgi:2,4-dienoyl-CoA reductase-like NADH-dependent reductase (Old Yellow Enzyme family)
LAAPQLFSPFRIRGTELRNRIVVSPMCQYLAVEGRIQDWHLAHHSRLALGGFACVFVEATAVTRDGRITYGCTGIWEDGQVLGLKRITDLHRAHGVVPGIQIGHAGRRASMARPWDGAQPLPADGAEKPWRAAGPSAVPEKEGYPVPRELTVAEIEDIIGAFEAAARRALAAGFEILELHGAHGYLFHSFFSPISNRRNDAYGGTREKRMRLPLAAAEAVRRIWPEDRPLFYRVSAIDGVEGGLSIEDSVALAKELKARGVDIIDCSSGGIAGTVTLSGRKLKRGFQVPYAEAIRRDAQMPTMAVGAILDGPQAEAIIEAGQADLIAIGREVLADPNWVYHAAQVLGLANPYAVLPKQYAFYLERRAQVLED